VVNLNGIGGYADGQSDSSVHSNDSYYGDGCNRGFGNRFGSGHGGGYDLSYYNENPSLVALIINDDPLTLACQAVTMFSQN